MKGFAELPSSKVACSLEVAGVSSIITPWYPFVGATLSTENDFSGAGIPDGSILPSALAVSIGVC